MVEVDTNFKLFLCVTLLVFPISALFRFTSLCVHIDGRTTARNEQFSELAAIEVIQRGGLCRIGV